MCERADGSPATNSGECGDGELTSLHHSTALCNVVVLEVSAEPLTLDEDTATWPIPDSLAGDFNKIKYTHRVLPLGAYDENSVFIEPLAVENTIKNSLVEVHF